MRTLCFFIAAAVAVEFVEGNSYKFLALDCQDSEVFQTQKCVHNETVLRVLTSINGSLNRINVELLMGFLMYFKLALHFFQILVGMFKFEKSSFRQIFKINKVDWCGFMAGFAKPNYMITFFMKIIKESTSKELFHKCPYEGEVDIINKALKDSSMVSIYPPGKYRIEVKVSDGNNAVMLRIRLDIDIFNWNVQQFFFIFNKLVWRKFKSKVQA